MGAQQDTGRSSTENGIIVAEISKSVAAAHGMRAHLVPAGIRQRLSQAELDARLAWSADLSARAGSCGNPVLASCYHQVAKAALTALPPAEVVQKVRNLRAKAAQLGSGSAADTLRRQADDLEAANPAPPTRAVVRKAADPVSADQTSLVALYDCDGELYGVCDGSEIVPALDPDVITKAASSGMIATHDPATGKPTGFVDPDAVTPVLRGAAVPGKPRKPAPAAAPGDVPGGEVLKAAQAALRMVPAYDRAGRLLGQVRADQIRKPGR